MIHIIRPHKFLFSMIVAIFLWQCNDPSDETEEPVDQEAVDLALIEAYLAENDSNAVAHSSGIFYSISDTVPDGLTQIERGSILSIYYTAKIMGGEVYDRKTSANGDDSVRLKQGVGAVFPAGLDAGLGLMKLGEKFKFYIPSTLAYGDYSFSSLIPAHSILEIEVELVNIENEADMISLELDQIDDYLTKNRLDSTIIDSVFNAVTNLWVHTDTTLFYPLDSVLFLDLEQVYYKRMTQGFFNDTLRANDLATIAYIGTTMDSTEFDRRPIGSPLTFVYGIGAIISGLEAGLSEMERGETALIILPSHKAYAESVFIIPEYRKQDFVDLEIVPQYAAKVAPYEILFFETSLLNNP